MMTIQRCQANVVGRSLILSAVLWLGVGPVGAHAQTRPATQPAFVLPRPTAEELAAAIATIETSKDDDELAKACLIVGRLGADGKAAVPAILKKLHTTDLIREWDFEWALARVGQPAMEAMLKCLTDPASNRKARESVVSALVRMGPRAAGAVDTLLPLVERRDPVARKAFQALQAIGPPARRALAALLKAAKAEDWEVQVIVAPAIMAIDPNEKEALEAVKKIARSYGEGGDRRVFAPEAAMRWRLAAPADDAPLDILVEIVKYRRWESAEPDWARFYACEALGTLGASGGPKAVAALIPLLREERFERSAAAALGAIGPAAREALPELVKAMERKSVEYMANVSAMEAIIRIGPKSEEAGLARQFLLRTMRNPVADHARISAAQGVMDLFPGTPIAEEAIDVLIKVGLAPDNKDRRYVIEWFGSLGPPAAKAAPELAKLIQDPILGTRAIDALSRITGE